jgi:hypothetical protein
MWVFDQCSCGKVGDCFCGGGSYSFFIFILFYKYIYCYGNLQLFLNLFV